MTMAVSARDEVLARIREVTADIEITAEKGVLT